MTKENLNNLSINKLNDIKKHYEIQIPKYQELVDNRKKAVENFPELEYLNEELISFQKSLNDMLTALPIIVQLISEKFNAENKITGLINISSESIFATPNVPDGSAYKKHNGQLMKIIEIGSDFVALEHPTEKHKIDFKFHEIIIPNIIQVMRFMQMNDPLNEDNGITISKKLLEIYNSQKIQNF